MDFVFVLLRDLLLQKNHTCGEHIEKKLQSSGVVELYHIAAALFWLLTYILGCMGEKNSLVAIK